MRSVKVPFIDFKGIKPVKFEYERILCVSVAKCPARISAALRQILSMAMEVEEKKKFVAFTDPYLMTACNVDEVIEAVKSAYKDKRTILVFTLNSEFVHRMRAEQFRNRWKVSYYTFEAELDENDEHIKTTLIRPKKDRKRAIGQADEMEMYPIYEPFVRSSDRTSDITVENYDNDSKNNKKETK